MNATVSFPFRPHESSLGSEVNPSGHASVLLAKRVRPQVKEDPEEVVDHEHRRADDEGNVGFDGFVLPGGVPDHRVNVLRVHHHPAVVAEGVETEFAVALAEPALPNTSERYVVIHHLNWGMKG